MRWWACAVFCERVRKGLLIIISPRANGHQERKREVADASVEVHHHCIAELGEEGDTCFFKKEKKRKITNKTIARLADTAHAFLLSTIACVKCVVDRIHDDEGVTPEENMVFRQSNTYVMPSSR